MKAHPSANRADTAKIQGIGPNLTRKTRTNKSRISLEGGGCSVANALSLIRAFTNRLCLRLQGQFTQ
jgi:hypothetical protein